MPTPANRFLQRNQSRANDAVLCWEIEDLRQREIYFRQVCSMQSIKHWVCKILYLWARNEGLTNKSVVTLSSSLASHPLLFSSLCSSTYTVSSFLQEIIQISTVWAVAFLDSLSLFLLSSSDDPHESWLFLSKYRILNFSLMSLNPVFQAVSPTCQDHSELSSCPPMYLQFLPAWCSLIFNKQIFYSITGILTKRFNSITVGRIPEEPHFTLASISVCDTF